MRLPRVLCYWREKRKCDAIRALDAHPNVDKLPSTVQSRGESDLTHASGLKMKLNKPIRHLSRQKSIFDQTLHLYYSFSARKAFHDGFQLTMILSLKYFENSSKFYFHFNVPNKLPTYTISLPALLTLRKTTL